MSGIHGSGDVNGCGGISRRTMLATTAGGLLGGAALLGLTRRASAAVVSNSAPATAPAAAERSRVALVKGDSHVANIFEALKRIEPDVRRGLAGKKNVLIKPNMVVVKNQLTATHADCLEGILEFLSPIFKGEVIVAESPASNSATEGFDNYGYYRLQKTYKVRFVDMDAEGSVIRHIADGRYRPQPVRFSRMLLDPDTYIISSAVMKTHDRAIVTLSLKNLLVAGVLKDVGFKWSPGTQARSDKWLVHGGKSNEAIHYNLFSLAQLVRPNLSVIDGFTGMEGNGPVNGTAVEHRVAVASTDWLAAERVAVDLMGFEFAKVGYLTFCAAAGMGKSELSQIEVLGGNPADLARKYRPHDNVEQQYKWMLEG
jgi:uncharacterized protein (DUF362 family)